MIQKIKTFISSNRREVLIISVIALLALVLRLYKIPQYLTFLGDEGRDVRVVRNLIQGDLVFIGPQTSIGNMYLGPLYYYMMAPFLWLWNLSPVGPAVMVAILSTITTIFIWWAARTWFAPAVGLVASLFYAISPVAIIYGRTSWNPNPMPFFALLSIWSIWQLWQHRRFIYIVITAVALAFALQMHYLGLLLIPVLGIFWLITAIEVWPNKENRAQFVRYSIFALLAFIFLMSPLVLFDLKHDFLNYNAFKTFFTNRQTTINLDPTKSNRFMLVINKFTSDLVLSTSALSAILTSIVMTILTIFYFIRTSSHKRQYFLLITWLVTGIFGLGLYKQHVYAHYFGFLYPAIYILIAYLLWRLFKGRLKVLSIIVFVFLVVLSIENSPLKQTPNRQLQRTEEVVDFVIDKSQGEPFNFALIAKQNYDESYRYFLENKDANFFRGEEKLSEQLFVVCEKQDCQPEGDAQYQVAIFGPAKTTDQWQIDHIEIFRLIHK